MCAPDLVPPAWAIARDTVSGTSLRTSPRVGDPAVDEDHRRGIGAHSHIRLRIADHLGVALVQQLRRLGDGEAADRDRVDQLQRQPAIGSDRDPVVEVGIERKADLEFVARRQHVLAGQRHAAGDGLRRQRGRRGRTRVGSTMTTTYGWLLV